MIQFNALCAEHFLEQSSYPSDTFIIVSRLNNFYNYKKRINRAFKTFYQYMYQCTAD